MALGAGCGFASTADAESVAPVFIKTPCALPDVSPEITPRLACGFVVVPRDHDKPMGNGFRLAIVIFRSASKPALPDPVVYVSGSPCAVKMASDFIDNPDRPLDTVCASRASPIPFAPSR